MKNSTNETALSPYLADINALTEEYESKKNYVSAARKNLNVITVTVVRETIAPIVLRQEDPEPLTTEVGEQQVIRAMPNKLKYPERQRTLQVLRNFDLGGRMPQNRGFMPNNAHAGDYYDISTMLFGDSVMRANTPLSVTSSAKYSDALSVKAPHEITDMTFHQRSNERGTMYNEEEKKSSNHIFEMHVVNPGSYLVQNITFLANSATSELLDFFLMVLSAPISAGGRTSITGTNVKTHVACISASKFETEYNSPYKLVEQLLNPDSVANESIDTDDVNSLKEQIVDIMTEHYPVVVNGNEIEEIQLHLNKCVETGELPESFTNAQERYSEYFTAYFG